MKKIILLFIIILCLNGAYAQKLELSLNGGAGFNTVPKNSKDSVVPSGTAAVFNYAISVKVFTNVNKWQFGLGVDLQKISRKLPATKYVFANPASPVYLMANYTFAHSYKGYFYGGLEAGLMFANSADYQKYSDNNVTKADAVFFEPGHGYMAGANVGGVIHLSAHFDLNAELGGKYAKYGYTYTHVDNLNIKTTGSDHYNYIYPSLTIGLRLKLFNDPFRQW